MWLQIQANFKFKTRGQAGRRARADTRLVEQATGARRRVAIHTGHRCVTASSKRETRGTEAPGNRPGHRYRSPPPASARDGARQLPASDCHCHSLLGTSSSAYLPARACYLLSSDAIRPFKLFRWPLPTPYPR